MQNSATLSPEIFRLRLQRTVREKCPSVVSAREGFSALRQSILSRPIPYDDRLRALVSAASLVSARHYFFWEWPDIEAEYNPCGTEMLKPVEFRLRCANRALMIQMSEESLDPLIPDQLFEARCANLRQVAHTDFLGAESEAKTFEELLERTKSLFSGPVRPVHLVDSDLESCFFNEFIDRTYADFKHLPTAIRCIAETTRAWSDCSSDERVLHRWLFLLAMAYVSLFEGWPKEVTLIDQGQIRHWLTKGTTCALLAFSSSRCYLAERPWSANVSHRTFIATMRVLRPVSRLLFQRKSAVVARSLDETFTLATERSSLRMRPGNSPLSTDSRARFSMGYKLCVDASGRLQQELDGVTCCEEHIVLKELLLADAHFAAGLTSSYLNEKVTASGHFQAAIAVYRKADDREALVAGMLHVANCAFEKARRNESQAYLQEALAISKTLPPCFSVAYAELLYSELYCWRIEGKLSERTAHLARCVAVCNALSNGDKAQPHLELRFVALRGLAASEVERGCFDSAINILAGAIADSNKGNVSQHFHLCVEQGALLLGVGQSAAAEAAWEKALCLLDSMSDAAFQNEWYNDVYTGLTTFEDHLVKTMVLMNVQRDEAARAFAIADRNKASVLCRKAYADGDLSHGVQMEHVELQDVLDAAKRLDATFILFCFYYDSAQKESWIIAWIIGQTEQSFKTVCFTGDSMFDMKRSPNKLAERLLESPASPNVCIPAFTVSVENVDLGTEGPRSRKVPINAPSASIISSISWLEEFISEAVHANAAKRLFIVPDGQLHSVPFLALPIHSTLRPFLIQHRELTIIPSVEYVLASEKRHPKKSTAHFDKFLIVANAKAEAEAFRNCRDLPFAEKEVDALATLIEREYSNCRPRVVALKRIAATKAAIIESIVDGADVVHFATHGFGSIALPGECIAAAGGLLVSSAKDDVTADACILNTTDIKRLDMRATALVVLNCCFSAGDLIGGAEGVPALARAFLYAGCARVLVTSRPVEDNATTVEFVKEFYRAYLEDGSASRALQVAVELLIQHGVPSSSWEHYYVFGS